MKFKMHFFSSSQVTDVDVDKKSELIFGCWILIRDAVKKKFLHILGTVSLPLRPPPSRELGTPYFDLRLNDSLFSPK